MNPKHRVFWEWLADQYEEWADDPPKLCTIECYERHTCSALETIFRWCEPHANLKQIWRFRYGPVNYPAGDASDVGRNNLRHEFCWWMADTIREYLETGKGPWETD